MSRHRIRPETAADAPAIRALTAAAFRGKPYAGGDEQDVIDRLRDAGELVRSLVAIEGDAIVGQITFSRASAPGGEPGWYALGPVSVLPARQGAGIGAALVREGLAELRALGARGCVLTGDPTYYGRFGFTLAADNTPEGEPEAYFQMLCFDGSRPAGRFAFHRAFYGDP